MTAIRHAIYGRVRPQGESYLIVPGPWRVRVWRRRHPGFNWHGIPTFVLRVSRPGPAHSRRVNLGPLRFRVGPSLGKIVKRTDTEAALAASYSNGHRQGIHDALSGIPQTRR